MRAIKGYLDEWRIQEYLLLTFFISWLSWGILILLTGFNIIKFTSVIGIILFGIGGFGPTIAAIMCMEGKTNVRKVWQFIVQHKKGTFGFLLLFAVLEIATIALSSMEVNPQIPLFILPVLFIMCAFVGGGNEELGWRGTLQPLATKVIGKKVKNPKLNFILVALMIGIIWAIWHLPLWFVEGTTQQGMNYGLFFLECILLSFWLGCIYNRTRSVLFCLLFHGLTNVLMSFFVIKLNWVLVLGFIVMTALAVFLAKPRAKPQQKVG